VWFMVFATVVAAGMMFVVARDFSRCPNVNHYVLGIATVVVAGVVAVNSHLVTSFGLRAIAVVLMVALVATYTALRGIERKVLLHRLATIDAAIAVLMGE